MNNEKIILHYSKQGIEIFEVEISDDHIAWFIPWITNVNTDIFEDFWSIVDHGKHLKESVKKIKGLVHNTISTMNDL